MQVNPDAAKAVQLGQGGIIANPNCSTIIALMAVTPLHRAAGVKRIVVSTYQVPPRPSMYLGIASAALAGCQKHRSRHTQSARTGVISGQ